jgi:hypothetical protein
MISRIGVVLRPPPAPTPVNVGPPTACMSASNTSLVFRPFGAR